MAKIMIIGDPHFKVANQHLVVKFISWLHEMVEELKPDIVVNLGDTFHTHNVIRSEIMAIVHAHMVHMNKQACQYYILVGNHDMAHHKTPDVHAWLPYVGTFPTIKIVQKSFARDGIGFMPYIDSPEEFQAEFNKLNVPLVFCHQTFIGANYGYVTSKDGVPLPTFDGQIVSGHIHKGQDLGCVWYPGTPFAQEMADHNEVKGIYLFDQASKERTFYQSPLPQWVTSVATPANFVDVIGKMDKINKNHLVVEGPGPEVAAAVDSKLFKDLKKEYGFSVKKESTSADKSSKTLKKVSTVEDAVVEYIDRIYDGSVDKAQLKLKCLEALQ